MELITISEIIGTIAFAISGALVGINKKLDYYGIVILAITTALGGGICRDMLIGNTPPAAFTNPAFTIISIMSAVGTICFHNTLYQYNNLIQISDAIGLAAFTVIGVNVAVTNHLTSWFIVITLGGLTGTGGGMIRDVFVKEIPFVFRKEIYAGASILGAIVYLACYSYCSKTIAIYSCFIVTFAVRMISIKYKIHLKVVDKVYTNGNY